MEERVAIWDADGNPTGREALKSEAHKNGWFHPTVHIWFYTADGRILLQQRSAEKTTYPLLWDVSVAGHISAGESIEEAALRETAEEIGLDIQFSNLEPIGVFKSVRKHREDLIDCEFHHTFLGLLSKPITELKKQDDEVAALKLLPLITFAEELWGMANPGKYVPHQPDYYKTVIRQVQKRL